jgi:hypothetical protein
MKSIRTTLFLCITLLAMAAFAVQYPTSPSAGQSSQSPQTSQGSTHPDQQAPSSPSSAPTPREDQQPQGSTQPSQSGQEQQGAQQQGRPTIDDQVRMLTAELNLSPDQQSKLRSILETQHQQAMTVVNDNSLSRDQKIQKIHTLRESTIGQARAIMNDQQKAKLDSMLQQQQQQSPTRMHPQGEQQSPGSTPPSTGSTPPPSSGSTPPRQ